MHEHSSLLVFEGLPCCGKTSLGRHIGSMGFADLCDEVMVPEADSALLGRRGAIENDRRKTALAYGRRRALILDRYFYSTVAYEVARGKTRIDINVIGQTMLGFIRPKNIPEHEVMAWYPNITSSIQRSHLDKEQVRGPEWRSQEFLSRFSDAYNVLFDCSNLNWLGVPCRRVYWVEEEDALSRVISILSKSRDVALA